MASFEVTAGPAAGKVFPLPEDSIVSVGREDDCTIQILDPSMSRKHLQVRRDGGGRVAADYRSANGVFVNGTRVVDVVRLKDGDELRLGDTTLVFRESDDGSDGAPADRSRSEWKRSTMIR